MGSGEKVELLSVCRPVWLKRIWVVSSHFDKEASFEGNLLCDSQALCKKNEWKDVWQWLMSILRFCLKIEEKEKKKDDASQGAFFLWEGWAQEGAHFWRGRPKNDWKEHTHNHRWCNSLGVLVEYISYINWVIGIYKYIYFISCWRTKGSFEQR